LKHNKSFRGSFFVGTVTEAVVGADVALGVDEGVDLDVVDVDAGAGVDLGVGMGATEGFPSRRGLSTEGLF
jgi:hypothetical protein